MILLNMTEIRTRPDAWHSLSTSRLRVYDYVIYFQVHCGDVTNISDIHCNLSPVMKIYRRHRRMRSDSASRKNYRLVCWFVYM